MNVTVDPIPDEPRDAFHLSVERGRWVVDSVMVLDRPAGGWFRSGFQYRIGDGTTSDGRDLFTAERHAVDEARYRNERGSDWNGERAGAAHAPEIPALRRVK